MSKVTLIDYDIGNLLSVERALRHIDADFSVARSAAEIDAADKLILPGVGAFASCTGELEARGFMGAIKNAVKQDKPLLGICVGMQMLFDKSEEFGDHAGLGFFEGVVSAIPSVDPSGAPLKIPHIGWTSLQVPGKNKQGWNTPILKDIPHGAEVYFVHSFSAHPANDGNRTADSQYGGHNISSIVSKGNIHGTQFHPEKSGEIGLKILQNFADV